VISEVTRHARKRGKERMGLSLAAVERMADMALMKGIKHSETTGAFRKYLDRLFMADGKANVAWIYAETIFLFYKETLITVLNLPKEYRLAVTKIKLRKAEGLAS